MVAYADTRSRTGRREIQLFDIEQLIGPGTVAARPMLASVRYHPAEAELNSATLQLPWSTPESESIPKGIVGEWARELGAKTPGRLVSSAKSWLSHAAVERSAAILPWGGVQGVTKISPLHASASYLLHIRLAWDQRFADYPLASQDVVLTLPASFDDAARALTVEAAQLAGLEQVLLLEEPQAACYDWLYRQGDTLESALEGVQYLLVCDVGGGTTDLSLIEVHSGTRGPELNRIGVGDHLMLGGDNMDLALARLAEQRLTQGGAPLSTAQLSQLIQQSRSAKERLLAYAGPHQATITLLGTGRQLLGSARSTELSQAEVLDLVLDGFFPRVDASAQPQSRRGAIVEFGLPYVADPAISRHLAAFLQRFSSATQHRKPDAVLLNGGVFQSSRLAQRLIDILTDWHGAPVQPLINADPNLAVARGAVAYGMARRGKGLKIGGGSARSYFLLLDNQADNVRQGVCLLPRASKEGREIPLKGREFALRLGQPVRFHMATTTAAKRYRGGDLIALGDDDTWTELPPVATVLTTGSDSKADIRVQLMAELTEIGTLAVSCVALDDPSLRWQLEFQLRGTAAGQVNNNPSRAPLHPRFQQASELIQQFYGGRSKQVDPRTIKTLRQELEKILGPRDSWDTALLRELFAILLEGAKKRRRSADHERLWFNLAGFCLRPGFGYPLDDWRIEQLWPLFAQGIQYGKEAQLWAEWWTLWRRVAGGLDGAAQLDILDDIAPYLRPATKSVKIKGVKKQGFDDMVRLAAALEHISAERKAELGDWLIERLAQKQASAQTWWALGRLGTRVPFHGSAHNVVARATASEWLEQLLALDWKTVQAAAFAGTLIARRSGDRERDLDPAWSEQIAARLKAIHAPDSWLSMVTEITQLDHHDEQRVFGETLPPGLRLVA